MSIGPIPLVSVGSLSGNLPTGSGARTQGAPAQVPGTAFIPVALDESRAVSDLQFNAYTAPKISADNPATSSFDQQLSRLQGQDRS